MLASRLRIRFLGWAAWSRRSCCSCSWAWETERERERDRTKVRLTLLNILILEEVVSVGDTAVEDARDSARGLNMGCLPLAWMSALWNGARGRLRCLFGKMRCATRYYLPTPLPNNFPTSISPLSWLQVGFRVRLITSVYVDNQASPHRYQ